MNYDLEYYLRQVRRIAEHREAGCNEEIKKLYKELEANINEFLGTQYAELAEDGKLTNEILMANQKQARFLEEIASKTDICSRKVAKEIMKGVKDTYKLSFDGMIDAVNKSQDYYDLKMNLNGIKAASPTVIKNAVSNKYLEKALQKNHKASIYDIKQVAAIGLSQGDRIETMSKRLSEKIETSHNKAKRIVRTETHRVREAGMQDSSSEIAKKLDDDYVMTKTWKTMQDMSVRPYVMKGKKGKKSFVMGKGANHVKMDGVTVLVDEEFELSTGAKAMTPGQSGNASEDINCRCRLSRDIMTRAEFEKLTGRKLPVKEEIVESKFTEDDILMDNINGLDTYKVDKNDIAQMSTTELQNFAFTQGVSFNEINNSSDEQLKDILFKKYDANSKEVIDSFKDVRSGVLEKVKNEPDELFFGMTKTDLDALSKTELENKMFEWGFKFNDVGKIHDSDSPVEELFKLVDSKKSPIEVSMTQDEYYKLVGSIAKKQKGIDTALEYQYVNTSNSFKINEKLYSKKALDKQEQIVADYLKENAIPLKKDMTLYRAVDTKFLSDKNLDIGEIIDNLGFSSTSFVPHEGFANRGVIMKINAPKGTKAFVSTNIDEGEFILLPGQKMRVRAVKDVDEMICTVWNTDKGCFNTTLIQKEMMGKATNKGALKIIEVDIADDVKDIKKVSKKVDYKVSDETFEKWKKNLPDTLSDDKIAELLNSAHDYSGTEYLDIVAASRDFKGSSSNYAKIMSEADKIAAKKKAEDIEELLEIAPKYEGKIYRGIGFEAGGDYDLGDWERFNKTLKEGNIIEMDSMSSWTGSERVAKQFADYKSDFDESATTRVNTIIELDKPKSGVKISDLVSSDVEYQDEVLMPKKAKYKIDKIDKKIEIDSDGIENITIRMKVSEVADDVKGAKKVAEGIDDVKDVKTTLKSVKGTKLYDEIADDLETYVGGGYGSVADTLNNDKTKLQIIKNSMEDTTKPLYRIEEGQFTLDSKKLKVGEIFEFDDDLRSASRSKKYIDDLLGDYSDVEFDEPVIFETVGKAKHFNMDEFTQNYYENQSESLIGGKFKVVDISDDVVNGKKVTRVKIEQIDDKKKLVRKTLHK